MSFWDSRSGAEITGKAEDAWLKDFLEVIPNGTKAVAKITKAELVEEIRKSDGAEVKEYRIYWKISQGEHKGREVVQKIKPFSGSPEAIDRNLNALKLLFLLTKVTLKHSNAPTDDDMAQMVGKELGIKIREWHMPKSDGTGFMEGNFVGEVHPLEGFIAEEGKKLQPKQESYASGVESALTRNPRGMTTDLTDLNDDIPF